MEGTDGGEVERKGKKEESREDGWRIGKALKLSQPRTFRENIPNS